MCTFPCLDTSGIFVAVFISGFDLQVQILDVDDISLCRYDSCFLYSKSIERGNMEVLR